MSWLTSQNGDAPTNVPDIPGIGLNGTPPSGGVGGPVYDPTGGIPTFTATGTGTGDSGGPSLSGFGPVYDPTGGQGGYMYNPGGQGGGGGFGYTGPTTPPPTAPGGFTYTSNPVSGPGGFSYTGSPLSGTNTPSPGNSNTPHPLHVLLNLLAPHLGPPPGDPNALPGQLQNQHNLSQFINGQGGFGF